MIHISPQEYIFPFVKKVQVSSDAFEFYFDRSNILFDFIPGQYIRVFLDIASPDERGSTRLFSITSAPQDIEYLCITTRIIQSAFKKALSALIPGTPVRFFGPMGQFVFDKTDPRPRVFLAGGIGVTPFGSMIRSAILNNVPPPLTLFVSYKIQEQMPFYEEFAEYDSENDWFRFFPTITHPEESALPWNGLTGRLTTDLFTKNVQDYKQALFYIAGPIPMVDAGIEMITSLGLPQEQIKKEKFSGY